MTTDHTNAYSRKWPPRICTAPRFALLVAAVLIAWLSFGVPHGAASSLPTTNTDITSTPSSPSLTFNPPIIACCGCIPETCFVDWACDLCENAGRFAIYSIDLLVHNSLLNLRNFMISNFWWGGGVGSAIGSMTESLTALGFTQAMMVGSFFDAKHQMETQNVLGRMHADAVRRYQPSVALCRFGTATMSLASSAHKARINKEILTTRSLGRHLGRRGSIGEIFGRDLEGRTSQFQRIYCDPRHGNGQLVGPAAQDPICGASGGDPERYNKDINITKTLFAPKTLEIDLTQAGAATPDEEDILALGANLYGYDLEKRLTDLETNAPNYENNRKIYHKFRALLAKRNIAENSFYSLASLKSQGTPESAPYLAQLLVELGMPQSEAEDVLSAAPSYDAQMEILAKKIYQSPSFVTSLIDKPENVKRQQAIMMAVELMQRRESYKSMLRQEMIVAVLLELFLDRRFKDVSADINVLKE